METITIPVFNHNRRCRQLESRVREKYSFPSVFLLRYSINSCHSNKWQRNDSNLFTCSVSPFRITTWLLRHSPLFVEKQKQKRRFLSFRRVVKFARFRVVNIRSDDWMASGGHCVVVAITVEMKIATINRLKCKQRRVSQSHRSSQIYTKIHNAYSIRVNTDERKRLKKNCYARVCAGVCLSIADGRIGKKVNDDWRRGRGERERRGKRKKLQIVWKFCCSILQQFSTRCEIVAAAAVLLLLLILRYCWFDIWINICIWCSAEFSLHIHLNWTTSK